MNILKPGPGVGGHCIAVDPWFIINAAPEETPLMRVVRAVNDGKPGWVVEQVWSHVPDDREPKDVKVACLGLAYKPDVDDLRESPSITVVNDLVSAGFDVRVVEPHLDAYELPLYGLEEAVAAADVVVVLTGHSAFKGLPAAALKGKAVVDTVGLYR